MIEVAVDWMLTNLTPTVSVLEVAWTLPALFGWARYWARAWRSLRAQRGLSAEEDRLSLRMRERIRAQRFLFLALVLECMALLGLSTMLQPPSLAARTDDPIALVGPLLFMTMQLAIILKGELIERHERALLWLYEKEAKAAAQHEKSGDVRGYRYEPAP